MWKSESGYGDYDVGRLRHDTFVRLAGDLSTCHNGGFVEGDVCPNLDRGRLSTLARPSRFAGLALVGRDHNGRCRVTTGERLAAVCRLVIVEGKGMAVTMRMIAKFLNIGDQRSAR